MPTLNYTTKVPVSRTLAEIQGRLAGHGASAVATRYASGEPVGVSFALDTPHGQRTFTLPVNIDGVHRVLCEQLSGRSYTSREHAARVAWRVVKDWLEAQLAIIAAGMAQLDQVMLPYLHVDGELTMYDAYREREQRALEGSP